MSDAAKPLKVPQRLLVPVDLSPISFQALDLARRLGGHGCSILLFYVQAPAYKDMETLDYDATETKRLLEKARRILSGHEKSGIVAKVIEGKIPTEDSIAAEAKKFKADLVVITTHGRSGLSEIFAGSVAQKVMHAYRGPLVMLRPERRK